LATASQYIAIAVAVQLAKRLAEAKRYYTYRFLFAPGTIGSITFLARNAERVDKIKHGPVLACAGDSGSLTYKRSRRGDAEIDQVAHSWSHPAAPTQSSTSPPTATTSGNFVLPASTWGRLFDRDPVDVVGAQSLGWRARPGADSEARGLPFDVISIAADALREADLLKE
jgi:hypothetical protein